jgi:hypothetical protein
MECEVVDEHPIISSRTSSHPATVQMRVNGVFGVLGEKDKGVIRLKNIKSVATWDYGDLMKNGQPIKDDVAFYTVYTHELGEGRVVCCCYATFDKPNNIADSVGAGVHATLDEVAREEARRIVQRRTYCRSWQLSHCQ